MFEKEAKEYSVGKAHEHYNYLFEEHAGSPVDFAKWCFQDGAEFGYNKANEWHYVKDGDLPKENKLYLTAMKDNGLAIAYFNGLHWETKFNLGDFGHCVEIVIAWKEIVLPELPKES